MRILVLGGDGYLGWPTAMHFSRRGDDVFVVDNFTRRACHTERGTNSLTPISTLMDRVGAWRQIAGRDIGATVLDITDFPKLREVVKDFAPDTIVHYGEIPSAPYSMIDRDHAWETQRNNVEGTLNLLFAMREVAPDAHLVKLGTMGEYGTPNIDIEEGYLDIEHNGRTDRLPFPKLPGSFYHLSKVHDSHNIHFACRVWGLRATDLNQGVVYGIHTDETELDDRLLTRFDYDELFGTALNRFCVESVIGHPITVYGTGHQKRAFLNIRDTLQCVEIASRAPAAAGEMRVFNQFTETFSVMDLASEVCSAANSLGYNARIEHCENPRVELEEHYYNPTHRGLVELGLKPRLLSEELIETMLHTVERFKDRVSLRAIAPATRWR
ncbi:MAG: NAD-dependent epimerase/dehydratase family protein [Acidimicrobiia bacterium]